MIQWCEDCKHFLWAIEDEPSREEMDYCRECLDESKPGEQAIRWEKREEVPNWDNGLMMRKGGKND